MGLNQMPIFVYISGSLQKYITADLLQSFAENTMNELLGWYGYDKVELRDSDDLEIRNYPDGEIRQHISVLKGETCVKHTTSQMHLSLLQCVEIIIYLYTKITY